MIPRKMLCMWSKGCILCVSANKVMLDKLIKKKKKERKEEYKINKKTINVISILP